MRTLGLALAVALVFGMGGRAQERHQLHSFEKVQLDQDFYSEGASFGDLNGDGQMDLIAGPFWYEGPEFTERHEIYPPKPFDVARYSDNFFAFAYDFDRDGAQDVLFIGFPGKDASWFRNPGKGVGDWRRHRVFEVVENESPTFADLTGDGLPELICQFEDRLGYAAPNWDAPSEPWTFHPISPTGAGGKFTHGLGLGDLDGDGRTDLLTRHAWWQQPESLEGDPIWQRHEEIFAVRGGAQMYADDLDGDGDQDVITSWNAHGYGLFWYEQIRADDKIDFVAHRIMREYGRENPYGLVIGNLHAIDLVDMDGDGQKDIITGARYWAHGGNDKADKEPALLYWLQVKQTEKGVEFIPWEIDDNSGVGTQVVVGDMSGNGLPDVVVSNKMGTFFHRHSVREVSRNDFLAQRRKDFTQMRARSAEIDRTGVLPLGEDGEALNLDFESGDMRDWTATGEAFSRMPVEGDRVKPRRPGSASNHQGSFWIGGYEPDRSDRATGELRSANFRVTHPYASFLVGGGRTDATRVELVQSEGDRVFFKASGGNRENMYARYVDLSELQGESIYIRLVDTESGGWGHINFDDFRFHAADPRIKEKAEAANEREEGFLPLEAAARMTVPEGFKVELVAGEPDLHQPIAFCIDDQGRIWVAEAHSYPVRRPDDEGKDRILVFDDSDGDGDWGAPTVFADDLNLVSGIEVGFGGVWVGAAPYLMFIPDRDGDLQPDGEPEILLDGWGFQDTHETLNAFNWGPDGWLYGCHGVFTHSRVGKPGTPDTEREPINAGVWRYHPTRHEFEVFAWGSSNPWGVDFDEYGQAVITACVIPHLFHVIQGARYHRQAGQHFNPYVFDDIKTIADHLHYLGATAHSGNGVSGSVGGGHAHCGAMVYLGDSFPDEYRGGVFMSNIHGNRFNVDHLSRRGSGLVGTHGKDFLLANDPWFRGINMRTGPDGNVYLIDWYDEQACHLRTPEIWDRSNGRLYKVSYEGTERRPPVGLANMRTEELVDLQTHTNDWQARVARRILQERGPDPQVHSALMELMERNEDPRIELRAVWTLHATGGMSEPLALALMDHSNEYLRAWAIQLALEDRDAADMTLHKLVEMSMGDPSPVVRLYLASALQRLPHEQRWDIAAGLLGHGDDAADHNLPLMIWYGIEPLVPTDPRRALELAWVSKIPQVSRFILRRMASGKDAAFEPLISALETSDSELFKSMLLDEMLVALVREGSEPGMPAAWSKISPSLLQDASYRDRAIALALFFGDSSVAPELRRRLQDESASSEARLEALENLLRFEDPELPAILHGLLDHPDLRAAAARGLASYSHPRTAELLIVRYESFDLDTRQAAVNTMSSRVVYAKELLQAIIDGELPSSALDSASARLQIVGLEDRQVNQLMSQAWGRAVPTPESKLTEIERLKELMSADYLAQADLSRGREIATRTCLVCHTLFGGGTDIGPDITGSNRADLDYILGNIIDPSAEVGNQYQMTVVALKNGRYLAGVVSDRTAQSLTIRNDTETTVVAMEDIAKKANGEPNISSSPLSLMPEGQLTPMDNEQIRDMLAYLASPEQVPMLATADNLASFFDGRSLQGWIADPAYWSVQNGELVGKTSGLDHNIWAKSELMLADFRLTLQVKLVDNQGNSGIQFRSAAMGPIEVKGYQADIGQNWWGKLYEEHGRGLLWEKPGDEHIRSGDWNTYEILAVGDHLRTAINGKLCVDLKDPEGARRGIIALQLHSGGATEVRFRNFDLELDPEPELKTLK